ncbi:hypothetical protein PR202_ga25031 [Eleusine coracana subsp. coracana]|uniref:PLAC8 family protein n=1 Tax=Eleusine coracana subsp. coracana TaxID=191504 RepID=A0AAV5D9V8_ELECO|nr:hypothetical protein QOZ80_9AG0671850 [Eleusine coracana subsp. coracana]GJN07218.1 hypothetical protein PR202_ga25031 [Eleusine coracana subsp. coracana]
MAVLGGGGDDQKHKLAGGGDDQKQKPAANGSLLESFEVETFYWPPSSPPPPSTRQMLGNNGDHHQQHQHRRDDSSSGRTRRRPFTMPFVKKMDWGSLWDKSKDWIKNPLNMALLVWIIAVGVSGAILFMVMTGMLNRALPNKPQRDTWFEVNNQILNALFTLMCLYQHPRRFYHLALLCRWRAGDMLHLRQEYCKDGTCKPDERKHMAVVILLLHMNCFAQYALCGLNLGYSRPRRPAIGVGITISIAICAPAVAGLYNNLSPLGKDYEVQPEEADEESQLSEMSNPQQLQRKTLEKRYSLVPRNTTRQAEARGGGQQEGPQWVGGLFDLWDDISLAYLSVFCSCCVFGWNARRLGFGNMYVHVVTFVLLCLAPFFIFNLAAVNIDNENVRDALGMGGVLLCVLGLLYGGFWRIQMRRRFRLPGNHACCGKPDLADCLQWLCCYSCSLAQEVRTADAYEVVQDRMHPSSRNEDGDSSNPSSRYPTLGDELSTVQQPLGFAGVFDAPPAAAADATSVNETATVPPTVSVIQKQ